MNNNEPSLDSLVEEIRKKGTQSDSNNLRIGEYLIQTKEIIGHGGWKNWFEMKNFSFSITTAKRFMRVSKGVENRPLVADLGIAKADALLRLDDDEYEKFISENNVKELTVKMIEGAVRKIKKSSSPTEAKLPPEKKEVETEPIDDSMMMNIDQLRSCILEMIQQFAKNKSDAIFDLRSLCEEVIERIEEIKERF